jgi:hypothetical protein
MRCAFKISFNLLTNKNKSPNLGLLFLQKIKNKGVRYAVFLKFCKLSAINKRAKVFFFQIL